MTDDQMRALLEASGANPGADGWFESPEHRMISLHLASHGASLTVGRVVALRQRASVLEARTAKGEIFVTSLDSVFAAAVEAPPATARKAGFV